MNNPCRGPRALRPGHPPERNGPLEAAHCLEAARLDATAPRSEITLDLPAGAQRLAAVRPGLTVVSAPGHVSAWIYASTHPYVTTTDTHGRYWLPDVAPGTYTLVFWHRPVRTTGGGDGRAVMLRRQVTVAPRREVVVDVALPAAVAP